MLMKRLALIALLLTTALPALAQNEPPPETVEEILYGTMVEDTITQRAFYDWWTVEAVEGDQMRISMAAAGGLEPLLGILDPTGTLVTRSEEGAADSTILLDYTVPSSGQYIIVATRAGNEAGSSTGSYILRLALANQPTTIASADYQAVVFRCPDVQGDIATAATIRFGDDAREGMLYRMTVYGLDGFRPVIKINFTAQEPFEACNTNADLMIGDQFTLPGEETRTVSEADLPNMSQFLIRGAEEVGVITLVIGSEGETPGRYMAIIEGLTLDTADDLDGIEARIGPLAAERTSMSIYMVAAPGSRLDPFITRFDTQQSCDDAGRRGCKDVLAFTGAGAVLNEGGKVTELIGDRSDAGLLLPPGSLDPVPVEVSSRAGATYGDYALIFIGELPPREPAPG